MKKVLFVLMLGCLTTTSLLAQDATSLKPVQGDLGVTVGINGLSNVGFNFGIGHSGTILFHYYLSNTWSLRGQLNITTQSTTQSYSDTTGSYSNSNKSSAWSVGLGIQHSFAATSRLDPYLAAEVFLGSARSAKTDSSFTGAGTAAGFAHDFASTPGSTFTFGAGLVFGFNYFITNHIAIGGEFLAGFSINNLGDGTRTTSVTEPVVGTTTATTTIHGNNNTSFGPNGSALVTFSYYFPAKW